MSKGQQSPNRYRSAFATNLFHEPIASRLATLPDFTWTQTTHPANTLYLHGRHRSYSTIIEIRTSPGPNLAIRFTLEISHDAPAREAANTFFDLRQTLLNLLDAHLVLNTPDLPTNLITEEIRATLNAERDELNLDSQQLHEFPREILLLRDRLTCLGLGNNRLTTLPPEFGQLTQLTELDLSNNRLEELPTTIGALKKLDILYLPENRLSTLPDEIGQLTSLRRLNLNQNRLEHLPTTIGNLRDLRELDLSQNLLTHLPVEFLQLSSLNDLDLHEWAKKHPRRIPPSGIQKLISYDNPWVYPPAEIMQRGTKAIRAWLLETPMPESPTPAHQYAVHIDDSYREKGRTHRHKHGDFPDCASAIAACQKIIDNWFAKIHRDKPAEELLHDYKTFGEDPFLMTTDPNCRFSAWTYVKERVKEIASKHAQPTPPTTSTIPAPPPMPPQPSALNGIAWEDGPIFVPAAQIDQMQSPANPALYDFTFDTTLSILPGLEPIMESQLRQEIPELRWQDEAENWGKIRILGIPVSKTDSASNPDHVSNTAPAPRLIVSIARKEPPGPFNIRITIRGSHEPDALLFHQAMLQRLHFVLLLATFTYVQPVRPTASQPSPIAYATPFQPPFFSLLADVPVAEEFETDKMAAFVTRLREAIPALSWAGLDEDLYNIRIAGGRLGPAEIPSISSTIQYTRVSLFRRHPYSPFSLWIHITATSNDGVDRALHFLQYSIRLALRSPYAGPFLPLPGAPTTRTLPTGYPPIFHFDFRVKAPQGFPPDIENRLRNIRNTRWNPILKNGKRTGFRALIDDMHGFTLIHILSEEESGEFHIFVDTTAGSEELYENYRKHFTGMVQKTLGSPAANR